MNYWYMKKGILADISWRFIHPFKRLHHWDSRLYWMIHLNPPPGMDGEYQAWSFNYRAIFCFFRKHREVNRQIPPYYTWCSYCFKKLTPTREIEFERR